MILLENLCQAIGVRVTEGDAGVACVLASRWIAPGSWQSGIGKIVFVDHLAAVMLETSSLPYSRLRPVKRDSGIAPSPAHKAGLRTNFFGLCEVPFQGDLIKTTALGSLNEKR